MKKTLIATATVLVALSAFPALGDRIQTYRLVEESPFAFRFSGGLSGYQFQSRLVGTFEVTVPDDEPAFISKMDIQIGEVSSFTNLLGFGSPAGDNLADFLHDDPLGLPVINNSRSYPYVENIDFDELDKIPFASVTRIRLEFESSGEDRAQFSVSSSQPFTLDGGSAFTIAPGFTVELIPEPSTLAISLAIVTIVLFILPRRQVELSMQGTGLR